MYAMLEVVRSTCITSCGTLDLCSRSRTHACIRSVRCIEHLHSSHDVDAVAGSGRVARAGRARTQRSRCNERAALQASSPASSYQMYPGPPTHVGGMLWRGCSGLRSTAPGRPAAGAARPGPAACRPGSRTISRGLAGLANTSCKHILRQHFFVGCPPTSYCRTETHIR